MANQEHLDLLNQGVVVWNTWRKKHPDVHPDLSGADLSFIGFDYTNFNRADPRSIERFKANLSGANLISAILAEVDLTSANLCGVDLCGVNLTSANLTGANFCGADLIEVNLSYANLNNTNLREAHFSQTIFAQVDLRNVKGLETAIHDARSFVDINTVVFPQDEDTNLHFLRGVGFTETQIEYLPSLLTPRPIQYHSLFISYAHQDEALAKRLYTNLRKNEVLCWFAPEDMKIGDKLRHRIDKAIHLHDKLLLLLSERSVASQWVEHEVETALSKERESESNVLFPLRLDNAVLKSTTGWASHIRLTRHIGDFTNWQDDTAYHRAFIRLLQDLKVDRPPTP